MSVLGDLPPSAAAAVIRLRSLGDCVLTTPALQLLKRHRPDLKLAVVVEDRFRAVYEGNPDIDEILTPSLRAVREFSPQLAINLHGGTRSLWLTCLSGARYRAGHQHYRYPFAYNVRIPRAQEVMGVNRVVHTAEHVASAMFFLGVPASEIPRATLATKSAGQPKAALPYCVLHPFAATPEKTWPAEGFLHVAEHLRREHELEPVFIGSSADDFTPFRRYRTAEGVSLDHTKALLQEAMLFVGNDSGPAHMAAAFGVPVVVIFGSSDAQVWAPWRTEARVLQNASCIGNVSADEVLAACSELRVKQ